MKTRLSGRLSPAAKKQLLTGGDQPVQVLLQVAAVADLPALCEQLAALGAAAGSWMEETRLLSAEVPADRLGEVAELAGVVYVDAAAAYRR